MKTLILFGRISEYKIMSRFLKNNIHLFTTELKRKYWSVWKNIHYQKISEIINFWKSENKNFKIV